MKRQCWLRSSSFSKTFQSCVPSSEKPTASRPFILKDCGVTGGGPLLPAPHPWPRCWGGEVSGAGRSATPPLVLSLFPRLGHTGLVADTSFSSETQQSFQIATESSGFGALSFIPFTFAEATSRVKGAERLVLRAGESGLPQSWGRCRGSGGAGRLGQGTGETNP